MKILHNDSSKIPAEWGYEQVSELRAGAFHVWHTGAGRRLPDELPDKAAVLVVSGAQYGAASQSEAATQESRSGSRVHFLQPAFSASEPLRRFLRQMEDWPAEVPPRWADLDPPEYPFDFADLLRRLEAVLPGKVAAHQPAAGAECLLLDFRRDFSRLWTMPREILDWVTAPHPRTIVVAWKPMSPSGTIPVLDYVTTFDWAAALTLTALDKYGPAAPAPRWRLWILDLASEWHTAGLFCRLFPALAGTAAVPFVRVFRPEQLDALVEAVALPPATIERAVDTVLLRRLARGALATTDAAGARHAIANLIGPQVLLRGMGVAAPTVRTGVAELRSWLGVLKLLPASEAACPGPWIKSKGEIERCVLLDDLAADGWEAFLREGVKPIPVKAVSNVHGFSFGPPMKMKRLAALLADAVADPRPTAISLAGCQREILFLDLRLFAEDGNDSEWAFLETLGEIARGIPAKQRFAWPKIPDEDLRAAEECVQSKRRESPDYYIAVTLLPRLLAMLDPALPIVVFSSTGRREIVERLRHCRNLILDFDKPRSFESSADTIVDDKRKRFRKAFKQAVRWDRARHGCRQLLDRVCDPPPSHNGELVEIYIDESRPKGGSVFTIGGMVLTYPDENKAKDLGAALVANGLMWGLAEGSDSIPAKRLDKYAEPEGYDAPLLRLRAVFQRLNILVRAFGLRAEPANPLDQADLPTLLQDGSIDNTYRHALEEVIEAVLFGLVAGGGAAKEVRVNVATRIFSTSNVEQWNRDFGVQEGPTFEGVRHCYSLTQDEVYPIVAHVLASRPKKVPVREARGVTLCEYKKLEDKWREAKSSQSGLREDTRYEKELRRRPRPRQIHYLADWVARFASHGPMPEVALEWFRAGFLDSRGGAFPAWLTALRYADNGPMAEALKSAMEAVKAEPLAGDLSFGRWARRRAAGWVREIEGNTLRELAGG